MSLIYTGIEGRRRWVGAVLAVLTSLIGPATQPVAAPRQDASFPPSASVGIHISGNRSFYWNHRQLRYWVVTDDPGVGDSLHGTLAGAQTSVHVGRLPSVAPLPASYLAGGGLTANVARARTIIDHGTCSLCHTIADSNASIVPSFTTIARSAADDPGARSKLATIIAKGSDIAIGGIKMPPHPGMSEADIGTVVDFILTLHDAGANPRLVPMSGELRLDEDSFPLPESLTQQARGSQPSVYVLAAAYRRKGIAPDGAPTASTTLRLRSPMFLADEASGSNGTQSASIANVGPVKIAGNAGAYLYFNEVDLTAVSHIEVTLAESGKEAVPNHGRIVLRVDSNDGRTLGTGEIATARIHGMRARLAIPIEHIEGFHRLYVMLEADASANLSRAAIATVEVVPGVSDHE